MSGRPAPRYAPSDPTLPKPWRGLVDGTTGYLYYWNPDTNVTQYERPLPPPPAGHLPPPPPPLLSVATADRRRRRSYDEEPARPDTDRYDPRARSPQPVERSVDLYAARDARDLRAGSGPRVAVGEAGFAEEYRRQHEISIIGDNVPPPFPTFESTAFPPDIMKEIHRAGFHLPTPIQAQSWPIALEGSDIVAVAKTGSGKTLGYLLPGFLRIKRLRNDPRAGPTVLVLAPTRELATQIEAEVVKFGRPARIACTCLYGGAPKGPQLGAIARGVDIVVATPGRLWDIMEMRRLSLRQVSYLVLDEADRMLDMGFEPQIRKIIKEVPSRRQTLMFTATWPKEVRRIADDLLIRPVQVNIGRVDELVANSSINQIVEVIAPGEKLRRLEQILRSQDRDAKVLIFCITKRMCDQLARNLMRYGVAVIHGDKSQNERERVLSQFRSGRAPVLIATDVAARGLDIKDIRMVINYDFPTGIEDYVHRIGRTGRAGATGIAHTFFSPSDARFSKDLIKILEGAGQQVPRELRSMTGRGGGGRAVRGWRAAEEGVDGTNLWGKYGRKNESGNANRGDRAVPAPAVASYDKYERYDGRSAERERDRTVPVPVGGVNPPSWHDIYNRYAAAPAPAPPPSKRPRTDHNSRSPRRSHADRTDHRAGRSRSPNPRKPRERSPSPKRSRSPNPKKPRDRSPSPRKPRERSPIRSRSPNPRKPRDRSPSPKRSLNPKSYSRSRSRSPRKYSALKNRSASPRNDNPRERSRSPKNRNPRESRSHSPKNRNPKESRSPSPKNRNPKESRSPSPKNRNPKESRSPSPKNVNPRQSRSPSPNPKSRKPGESRIPSPKREPNNADSPPVSLRPVSQLNGNGKRKSPTLHENGGNMSGFEQEKVKNGNIVVKMEEVEKEEEERRDEGEMKE